MLKDKMAKLFFLKSTIPYLKNKIKAKKKKDWGQGSSGRAFAKREALVSIPSNIKEYFLRWRS
jgi:hypothetical protein